MSKPSSKGWQRQAGKRSLTIGTTSKAIAHSLDNRHTVTVKPAPRSRRIDCPCGCGMSLVEQVR